MKIKDLHICRLAHPWKTRIFVVAEADSGELGIGEASVGQLSLAVVGAIKDIQDRVIGRDINSWRDLHLYVARDIYADGGQVSRAALAGIEIALWDLQAQLEKVSVNHYLGGKKQEKIRLYANGWYRGERDPEKVALLAKKVIEKGFTALKIDPFGSNWQTLTQKEKNLYIDILSAVREVIGSENDLIVEAHSRFSVKTAIEISKQIEKFNPLWLEEPIAYWDYNGYKEVVNNSEVPIATGESFWRIEQFQELLEKVHIPIIQFDPTHVGGFAPSQAIADLALEKNCKLAPHSASGLVNEMVCSQLGMVHSHTIILERFKEFEENDPHNDLIETAITVKDGYAYVKEHVGLGCKFPFHKLKELHTEKQSPDQNLFQQGWEKRK